MSRTHVPSVRSATPVGRNRRFIVVARGCNASGRGRPSSPKRARKDLARCVLSSSGMDDAQAIPPDVLLPGHAPGRRFVVFFSDGDAGGTAECLRFREADWPAGLVRVEVNVRAAPALREHFGLRRLPAIGIVEDGSLIALEYDCSPDSREFLLSMARAQRRRASREGDFDDHQ